MKISSLIIVISCTYGILSFLLRLIWLFFPNLLKDTKIYRIKEPGNFEKGLCYVAIIGCMLYAIYTRIGDIIP